MEEVEQGFMFTKLAYSDIVYCPAASAGAPPLLPLSSTPLPSVAAVHLVCEKIERRKKKKEKNREGKKGKKKRNSKLAYSDCVLSRRYVSPLLLLLPAHPLFSPSLLLPFQA